MASYSASNSFVDYLGNPAAFTPTIGGYQIPVTPTPSIIFIDNFDGTVLDTTNRWQSPVLAGTGTMSQASGNLAAATGTTASNGASITSIENFQPSVGTLTAGTLLGIEASPGTNTSRCFGFYTKPAGFTAATPVQDGYVWELDITGTFGASIYSGGTRIFRQTFTGSTFTPVSIGFQGLNALFYINSFAVPALTVPLLQPSTLTLPLGFHCINHTSVPASAPTWTMQGTAVLDASGSLDTIFNGQTLSRLRYPGKFITLNAVSIAAETTIWTPASGRKFRLMGYNLTSGTVGGNVLLKDNTAGSTIHIIPFGAASANVSIPYPGLGNGNLSSAVNNVLTATGTATQTLSGTIWGTEE